MTDPLEHRFVLEALEHKGSSHDSNRAWDMAVLRACLRAVPACTDDQMVEAVREHRRRWGGEERIRADDLAASIDRARAGV